MAYEIEGRPLLTFWADGKQVTTRRALLPLPCDKDRICESPHFAGACASVGIAHGKTTAEMARDLVCEGCPVRHA